MSTKSLPVQHRIHAELIAIGVEIAINPERRQHYSRLILQLADIALQELIASAGADSPPSREEVRPDDV